MFLHLINCIECQEKFSLYKVRMENSFPFVLFLLSTPYLSPNIIHYNLHLLNLCAIFQILVGSS